MNPFIVMVIGALLGLKRVCPKCKKVQIVSSDKRRDTVPEVDPVFLDTGLGDNQWSRRSGRWQESRMMAR